MAYSQRQEQTVKIGAYIYNGGYRAFSGYPVEIELWNVDAKANIEFTNGKAVTSALDGFEYSNQEGYRLSVNADVNNLYDLTDQGVWRSLFQLFAGEYDKTFATVVTNGTGSGITTLVLTNAASDVDDFYNGLQISAGLSSGNGVIITDYVGASRTATLSAVATWSNGVNLTITAQPNIQRVIGLSITNETADIIYYNLNGNAFGLLREFTMGKSVINFSLRSVERYSTIPDSYILNG
jgi:hypothetical protein